MNTDLNQENTKLVVSIDLAMIHELSEETKDIAQTLREALDSVLVGFSVGFPRGLHKGYCTATFEDCCCGTWEVQA